MGLRCGWWLLFKYLGFLHDLVFWVFKLHTCACFGVDLGGVFAFWCSLIVCYELLVWLRFL